MYKDVQGAKLLHNKSQVRCVRSAELYWKDPPQCRCERERNPKTKNNKMFDTTLKLNNAEQGSGEFSWQCCQSGNTITYTNNVQYLFEVTRMMFAGRTADLRKKGHGNNQSQFLSLHKWRMYLGTELFKVCKPMNDLNSHFLKTSTVVNVFHLNLPSDWPSLLHLNKHTFSFGLFI